MVTSDIINSEKGEVTMEEINEKFVKKQDNAKNVCPNCNAKLKEQGSSVKCEYCGSIITRKTNELILIDKKMIRQSIK